MWCSAAARPDIDPRNHRLLIHGLVDRPVILTMEEIRRLPSTSRILFLECSGNTRRSGARRPGVKTSRGGGRASGVRTV